MKNLNKIQSSANVNHRKYANSSASANLNTQSALRCR